VQLSDDTRPFIDEEAVYAAVTTTPRSQAIGLDEEDFRRGGLSRESYVNPWTLVTIRHADMRGEEAQLIKPTVDEITEAAAGYLGV